MNSLSINGYGEIRQTDDSRYSVYDVIRVVGGKKNPHETWTRLLKEYSELTFCEDYQFPGARQRKTPVAATKGILIIIGLLPGAVGATYRSEAADLMRAKLDGTLSVEATQQSTTPISLIKESVAAVLGIAGLHPNLIAGVTANVIAKEYPHLSGVMEEVKKALPARVEQQLITVTELAVLYSDRIGQVVSARAMNKLLAFKGLQERNSKGNPDWMPIGQGNEFGSLVLQTAKGKDKTIQQLRWYPSVLDVLEVQP